MEETHITSSAKKSDITTERQERAIQLNTRIRTNSALAVQCILEIARDLKTMNTEKLYKEVGCATFGEYCEKVGIGERHGYNYIKLLTRFGEERLESIQNLGVTKLIEMSRLDDDDVSELIESGAAEEMSVKQLKEKIKEYEERQAQLTLDLEEAQGIISERHNEAVQAEENSRKLAEITQAKERLEERLRSLEAENKELKERPIEVVGITEEERTKIYKEASDEIQSLADTARDAAVKDAVKAERKKYETEIASLKGIVEKAKADKEHSADKYREEIERLKSENSVLQSNAEKAAKPVPMDDSRARIKICLEEIQQYFNLALETINAEEAEIQPKHKAALKTVLAKMEDLINAE